MKKIVTQEDRVYEWLKEHKTITSREAFIYLGVTRLSAVIFKLKRNKGVDIQTYRITPKNRYGGRSNCGEYHLIEEG